jgi:AraC-like DNA-binding protein
MSVYPPPFESFRYQLKDKIPPFFHTHPKHEIYYFHSGKCKYVIGGIVIDLQPGDLILMNGIREHGPIMDDSDTYVRTTILFDGAALQRSLSGPIDVLAPFRLATFMHWRLAEPLKSEWEEILARMHRFAAKQDAVGAERLRLAFMEALLFVYERCAESESAALQRGLSGKERIVQRVMDYIDARYMEDLAIADIARGVPISRYYLMKVFKELTGMTVFAYLNRRRIDQAKVLLALGTYSITDVSFMVGFKHVSHFSRNFKKITGMAPETYRKTAAAATAGCAAAAKQRRRARQSPTIV